MKPIIGIVGKAGSGKDTVAKYLTENYGFVQLSLAEPIKDFAKTLFNFSDEQLWGSSSNRDQYIEIPWEAVEHRFNKHAYNWLKFFGKEDYLLSLEQWLWSLYEKYPNKLNVRIVAQTLGTEFGRNTIHEDLWINHLLDRTEFYLHDSECKGVVTSDVRFQNEMDKIHDKNGKIIRLLRNKDSHTGILGHQSEIEQDLVSNTNFDFIIENNRELSKLYEALDIYMKVIHLGK